MFQEFDIEVNRLKREVNSKKGFRALKEIAKLRDNLSNISKKSQDISYILQLMVKLMKESESAIEFYERYTSGVPSFELIIRDLVESDNSKPIDFGKAIDKLLKVKD